MSALTVESVQAGMTGFVVVLFCFVLLLEGDRTQFSSACAWFTVAFGLFMVWRPFFAGVMVDHTRVYSRILCAVAMATGLVKNKA